MQIVCRTDASLQIGSGQVVRCLALAEVLGARGAQCHFISRAHPGHLFDTIRQRGFTVTALPSGLPPPDTNAPAGTSLTKCSGNAWSLPGLSARFASTASAESLTWLTSWFAIMRGVDVRQFQLPKNTRLFLGDSYLLLRPEIMAAVRLTGRSVPRRALMVVAGGTYQAQWISSILAHVAHVASDCPVCVLSGRGLPAGKVLQRSGVRRSQVRLFSGLDASAMIRRYRQARCLVTPASTVMLEAFGIGCPDFLAQARLKPESVKIGYFGAGTQVNLLGLQEATGAKFLLVPFRSNADANASTQGRFIDAHVDTVATVVAQAGKLRALSFGGRTATLEVPETHCHDIDNLVDWELAEIKHEHRVARAGKPGAQR